MSHVHEFSEPGMQTVLGPTRIEVNGCTCGMRERRRYLDARLISVRYSFGYSIWLDPVQLLTMDLPVTVCPVCKGAGIGCEECYELGLLDLLGGDIVV